MPYALKRYKTEDYTETATAQQRAEHKYRTAGMYCYRLMPNVKSVRAWMRLASSTEECLSRHIEGGDQRESSKKTSADDAYAQ